MRRYGNRNTKRYRKRFTKRYNKNRVPRPTFGYVNKNRITTGQFYNEPGVMPDRLRVRLKYNEVLSRTAAGAADFYQFSVNDLYDPNITGTGTQPSGFDQLGALYNRWRVLASSIRIRLINNDADDGIRLSVVPINGTTTHYTSGYNGSIRNPLSKQCFAGQSTGNNIGQVRNYINLKKLTGDKGYMYDDRYAGGQAATSPNYDNPPGIVCAWNIDVTSGAVTSGITYSMDVEIQYYCEFFDRRDMTIS